MQPIVLVHGAWHGGWCYGEVARLLRRQGHEVFTPTLTGLGERSHLRGAPINLTTHIQDIVNVCVVEDLRDIVLVGHSYGGMVVTGVADKISDRISRLVYLDAFVPNHGESVATIVGPAEQATLPVSSDGLGIMPIPAAYWGVAEENIAWVDAQCVDQPAATFFEPITLSGDTGRIPRRYVLATGHGPPEGTIFTKFYNRLKLDPAWSTSIIDSGHDMMIDQPEETVRLILE